MRLSLATRIFVGYAVVLVTFGAVALFSVSELHRNQVEIRLVSEGYLTLSQAAAAIETFHKNQTQKTERLRHEPNLDMRRRAIGLDRLYSPGPMAEKLEAGAATARKVLEFAPASERPFVEDVARKFDELDARYVDYQEAYLLLESPSLDRAAADERLDHVQQLENPLGASIRLLRGALDARILERVRLAQERERRTGTTIIALSVLAILIGVLATGITARSLRPVRTLTDGAARISRGDYSAALGVTGDDEIAVLAREFDAMARSLREREALLVQKQEELLRAERLAAVGKVSAQVAHEIRNPLSSIGLNVEMLQDQLAAATFAGEAERHEAEVLLASVTRELDHLAEITEDYLRLARLPAPTLRQEDVRELVEGVLSFSASELERAGVKVVRELNGVVPVPADAGQLRQVLHNLVRNAREAMEGGGTLTVSARAAEKHLEIKVTDTGAGLSDEARARLFEPFFSTKRGGTGLGLSLSRQIVLAHGGTLEAAPSTTRGTTFVITLPRP